MKREQNRMGRGIVKWQPFASIPQQFQGIHKIMENQKKIPQPILEDDEQERINYTLVEAIADKRDVALVYWTNGRFETEIGQIKKADMLNNTVHFIDKFDYVQSVTISSVVDITFI